MSSTINHQPTITLEIRRCHDCGRFWALEPAVSGDCPVCTRRNKDARWEEYEQQARTIIALKGQLTKAKSRAGRVEGKQKRARGAVR